MAGQPTPRPSAAAANGAPTLTPLGHYAGRPNIPISRTVTLVGSRNDARLHLHSSTVSKAHCLIVNTASGAYVRDLASRTKVIVNGKPQHEIDLHAGDRLQIGKFEFRFNPGVALRPGQPTSFDAAPPAVLRVEGEDMPLPIESRVTLIGRRATCDVPLTESSVSTAHAVIYEMNGKRLVRDLGSRTGTFVNGRPIQQDVALKIGDELRIGETTITYAAPTADADELDIDELIAPAATGTATETEPDPLADLAAAVGGRGEAQEHDEEAQFELAGDAPEEQVTGDGDEATLEEPPQARPTALSDTPEEPDAAIEDELGLAPALDARRGWRQRDEDKAEPPSEAEPAEVPAEAAETPPEAEVVAADEAEPALETGTAAEAVTAEEQEEPEAPPLDLVFDNDAQFGADIDLEPQDAAGSERPLPGAAELADLGRLESSGPVPAEESDEDIHPPLALDDAQQEPATSDKNVPDEMPAGAAVLEEPAPQSESEFDLGDVPPLKLDESLRDTDAADTTAAAAEGEDTLHLGPLTSDTVELADDAHTQEPLDATLELKPPVAEPPADAPSVPETTDEPLRPAKKRRRGGRKKSERLDLSIPERPADEPVAPPAPAAEKPDDVEVLDRTQPTPESAQSLEDAVADILSEPPEQAPVSSELSDTAFGRNVEAFAGESSGPLVESQDEGPAASAPPQEIVAADASEDELQDTPFALEEPAALGLESDTAGQTPLAEKPLEEAAAEVFVNETHALQDQPTVDEAPDEEGIEPLPPLHLQSEPEPVAEAPQPAELLQPAEPPAPAKEKPLPTIDLSGWGPNQEHFLGGMPLRLDEPSRPQGPAKQSPRRSEPARPAAEAPRATPPRPQKGPQRKSSPFDLTPKDVPADDVGRTIPPFSGGNAKKGLVTTGFDGLAMPPVRQADVFSQMATPASFVNGILGGSDDVFGGNAGSMPGAPAPQPAAQRSAPRAPGGAAPARRDAEPHADAAPAEDHLEEWPAPDAEAEPPPIEPATRRGRHPARSQLPPTIPPTAAEAYPAPPRKRRWFGLRGLLLMMLLCMTAAVGAIYVLVPLRAVVQGSLSFRNFASLNEKQQRDLKLRQQQLLSLPSLRDSALAVLRTSDPAARAGFLSDGVSYSRSVAEVTWNGGTMAMRVNGTSPRDDRAGLHALLTALYQANGDLVDEASRLRSRVDNLSEAHARAQQRVAELKTAIDRKRGAAEDRPEPAEIAAIEEENARLETAWSEAVANVKNIEIDLQRMRDGLSAQPQPAGTAAVPVVDPQLAELEQDLQNLNNQIAELQDGRSTAAEEARQRVESALAAFEEEVAAASATTQSAPAGPELSAYLAEAQRLQRSTRELTDTLIRRQQQQTQKLTELKSRLNEKRDARRNDLIEKDPQLRQWNDELAIAQRQHSAAESAGLKNDADEYAAHIQTLNRMITARQALIGDDAFYADAISELENIIAETSRSLETDRQSTEAALEQMQAAFARSAPSAERLPVDQQALASRLTQRLAAVTDARRAYAEAADSPDGDAQLQKLRDSAAELNSSLADRKRQLAAASEKTELAAQEQERIEAIKQRETELAAARQAEAKAQTAWAASEKKLRTAQARVADARDAGETIDRLTKERDAVQAELELNLRTLEAARAQLAKKVDPLPPDEKDVRLEPGSNVRPTYSLIAVGGIAAVFTVLILLTAQSDRLAAAAAEPHFDEEYPEPVQPLLEQPGSAGSNGSGHSDPRAAPRREDEPTVSV